MINWFKINDCEKIISPALIFYADRIQRNIDQMIKIAGSVDRLRPHVKTYKCREIVEMQLKAGITKFKCATIMEAEMLASMGVKDILFAYPIIGPGQQKFLDLIHAFPDSKFSTLIDHLEQLNSWNKLTKVPIRLFIDIDAGMHRTGTSPQKAKELFKSILQSPFHFMGLHVYDGHIHDKNVQERVKTVNHSFENVESLIKDIKTKYKHPFEIVCGGSITFPIHAQHAERTLSPGTTLLWDQGYTSNFPDLPFEIAATLLTRVISKPTKNLLCFDLGHKAVASEMNKAPVYFPQIPDVNILVHSEEHLVVESKSANQFQIGDELYGIPWHICPTVALHEQAFIANKSQTTELWDIVARKRIYQLDK